MNLRRWCVSYLSIVVFVMLILQICSSVLPAWYQSLGSLKLMRVFFLTQGGQNLKQAQALLGQSSRASTHYALSNHYRLGLAQLYLEDNHAAAVEFISAVESSYQEHRCSLMRLDSYVRLADSMIASGEKQAALASLDHFFSAAGVCDFKRTFAPRLARLYIRAGTLSYELDEDRYLLESYYQNAVDLDQTTFWVLHRLIELLLENKEYDRAIEVYYRLVEVAPDDGRTYYSLGVIRYHQAYYTSAIEALSQAASMKPQDEFIRKWLGLSYLAVDDSRNAVCQFARVIELNPSCASCYEQLAIAFERQERADAALASLLNAYDLDQVYYSWVLLESGINEVNEKNYQSILEESILANQCE